MEDVKFGRWSGAHLTDPETVMVQTQVEMLGSPSTMGTVGVPGGGAADQTVVGTEGVDEIA